MLRERRSLRPMWLTGGTVADDAGESEFINEFYRSAFKVASGLCYQFPGLYPCCDLAQYGVIAALRLYRRLGCRPAHALAMTAAYREMIDVLRPALRARSVWFSLDDVTGEGSADPRLDLAAIDGRIDAGRLLRLGGDPRAQFTLAASACGVTLLAIGRQLGVGESRAHQLRAAALSRIRLFTGMRADLPTCRASGRMSYVGRAN